MWTFSTGLKNALLARGADNKVGYIANTISFTDSSIQDSANGLGNFGLHDFIRVIDLNGANNNVFAQVIANTSNELTFAPGTFTAQGAGNNIFLEVFSGGSFVSVFQNGVLDIYNGTNPSDADGAESGTLLCRITKNGAAFTPGNSANGCSVTLGLGAQVKKATDPATGLQEQWSGVGLADGTATWVRWYDNDVVTGASSTAIRMDGLVTQNTGGELVMSSGRDIITGRQVIISDVNFGLQVC
jgi:hypothetical protein